MKKYTKRTIENVSFIELEENGVISTIPTDETNSDFRAYLEHEQAPKSE